LLAGGFAALSWSAPDPTDEKYRATLKDGATIEIVGVSSYPTGPRTWWKPDGSPLDAPPVDPIEARVSPSKGEIVRVVLARVTGVKHDDTFRWLPTHNGSYDGGTPTKNGQKVPGLEYYVASFRSDSPDCAVNVKAASGPWRNEASDSGQMAVSFGKNNHNYYFGKARAFQIRYGAIERPGTAIAVAHDLDDTNNRIVAVGADGKIHTAIFSTAGTGGPVNLLDAEFQVPPD